MFIDPDYPERDVTIIRFSSDNLVDLYPMWPFTPCRKNKSFYKLCHRQSKGERPTFFIIPPAK